MDVFTDKLPETPKRSVTRAGVLRVLGVMLFFFLFGLIADTGGECRGLIAR